MTEHQIDTQERPSHAEEQALIRRVHLGDSGAFEALVYRYSDWVYRQANFILGNLEEAEEVTQEVFLALYRKAHTFRGEAAFSSWFYRLTYNMILGRLRQKKRFSACLDRLKPFPRAWVSSPEQLCVKSETQQMVRQAIYTLRPMDRAVVLLCDIEGFSNRDAGEILNLSVPSIKSRRHRARTRLRTLLAAILKSSPR